MKTKFQIPALFLACGALIFSAADLFAQGNSQGKGKGNSNKSIAQKEYKTEGYQQGKGKKDKSYKTYKQNGNGNAKKFPHTTPRNFKVPPGHYPPNGHYRIWYPGRPPGQQPAPVAYGYPANAPITDGAFIIHGGKAYDTQYDWRQVEQKKPRSVPRDIIDILFPNGVTPPAQ